LVLSLDHRIQRDGGADAGEGDDDLEEGAPERAGVGAAGADDVVLAFVAGIFYVITFVSIPTLTLYTSVKSFLLAEGTAEGRCLSAKGH